MKSKIYTDTLWKTVSDIQVGDKVWVVAGEIIEDATIIEKTNNKLTIKIENNNWLQLCLTFNLSGAPEYTTAVCKSSYDVYCFFNLQGAVEHLREKMESYREKANSIENNIDKWNSYEN